jgi:hypothetical protein
MRDCCLTPIQQFVQLYHGEFMNRRQYDFQLYCISKFELCYHFAFSEVRLNADEL